MQEIDLVAPFCTDIISDDSLVYIYIYIYPYTISTYSISYLIRVITSYSFDIIRAIYFKINETKHVRFFHIVFTYTEFVETLFYFEND